MMKKYSIVLLVCLQGIVGFGQISTTGSAITRSMPSIATMMNFEEIPVDLFTGVPDISVPIYSFPTRSKDINLNISLNYHPSGVSMLDAASETGMGWSLFGGGVISRTIVSEPNETYKAAHQFKNTFDDIYQFNFMGYSGRFRVTRNISNDTFTIVRLDDDNTNLKIDFVINPSTFNVDSFTMHDEKGYKYVFDVADETIKSFLIYNPNIQAVTYADVNYRSAHHLSKIYDNNGKELVSYSFNDFTTESGVPIHDNITKKLNEITVAGFGKAIFNYSLSESAGNDPLQLNDITIKNYLNENIKKYSFTYHSVLMKNQNRRTLRQIKEFDKTFTTSKNYEFSYNGASLPADIENYIVDSDLYGYLNITKRCDAADGLYPSQFTSPELCKAGVLYQIKYPTGGTTQYDFESNTITNGVETNVIENNITPTIFASNNYNTAVSRTFQFTLTQPKTLYFKFDHVPYDYPPELDPDPENSEPNPVRYKLNGGFFGLSPTYSGQSCLGERFDLPAGTYTITIIPVIGLNTTGTIEISEKIPNAIQKNWAYGCGVRIKKITNFTNGKTLNYDYNKFDDPIQSTGIQMGSSNYGYEEKIAGGMVGYLNVKVTESPNRGYTLNTFANPLNSFNPSTPDYWSYYLDYKKGILLNRVTYDLSNQPVSSVDNTYDYIEQDEDPFNYGGFFNTRNVWVKLAKSVSKSYYYSPQVSIVNTETFTYNDLNKKIATQSVTNSKGETLKTNYFYHTGNSSLSQNRIAEIEKVESYRDASLLSTSKINYGNTWSNNVSYLPQSVAVSKVGLPLETRLKYNFYDEYSNVLEVQQENGIKTAYIWGYNKTQPIAKIENATYAAVQSQVANLQSLSDSGTESNLITALNALRTSLPNAVVTTFTYKPLIGISTMTDSKGDKMTYEYDEFNQLKKVKDKNGNILSENQYHYKPQN